MSDAESEEMSAPDCYQCAHRRELVWDCHSACSNTAAQVTGNVYGVKSGWFFWPVNFDPVWLKTCDGFSVKHE